MRCVPLMILVASLGVRITASPAGPNLDGHLLLHANESVVYTGDAAYCNQSNLAACSTAVVTLPSDGETRVVHVVAAFSDSVGARLAGITFGIDYDPELIDVIDFGPCAPFEIADPGWPSPSTGTALSWPDRPSGRMIEVYWMATYVVDGGQALLELRPHPTQGGSFADGSVPPNIDRIAAYGTLGFGVAGTAPCPSPGDISGGAWGSIIGQ